MKLGEHGFPALVIVVSSSIIILENGITDGVTFLKSFVIAKKQRVFR
jgi:hypothetical protein